MRLPPKRLSPRVQLTKEMLDEAQPYALKSARFGLYERGYPENQIEKLFRKELPRSSEIFKESVRLGDNKFLGLKGEMAFNLYRGLPYSLAFQVAQGYYTRTHWYERVPPDGCIDTASSPSDFCSQSPTLDVKTRRRQKLAKYEGLCVYVRSLDRLTDDVYVGVSERSRADVRFTAPLLQIFGYALQSEVHAAAASYRNKFRCFIHFHDLHPIQYLNLDEYKTQKTVYDLI